MKKTFLMLFAAFSVILAGCGKDDTVTQTPNDTVPAGNLTPEDQILKDPSFASLTLNQALVGGSAVNVECTLAVRPPQQSADYNDPGAHYVDIVAIDSSFSIRLDLGTPNLGKYINLVSPLGDVGDYQFSIMITPENGYYSLDAGGETFYCMVGEEQIENASCFTSGMLFSSHTTADGFALNMAGALKDGKKIAIRVHLDESEVTYW